jgi:hypothetical protein
VEVDGVETGEEVDEGDTLLGVDVANENNGCYHARGKGTPRGTVGILRG